MERQLPNLLLIVVDQQRYDCIGYSDRYPVRTPNIDRLAGEGMWFSEAYTHIPICSPARQSFLNGRRPETFGGLWNYGISLPVPSLEPSEYAWPRELKKAGYTSAHLGKFNVHPVHGPTAYGYDVHTDSYKEYQKFREARYPDVRWTNGFMGEIDPVPVEDSATHWVARQASEMMEKLQEQGGPWHLRIDFTEPHLPCRPSREFAEMYRPEDIPVWGSFADSFRNKPYIQKQQLVSWEIDHYTWEDWAPIVARYYAVVSQLDDAIGKVLSKLAQLGAERDTLVLFTSDHGDLCGGHRMIDKHYVLYDELVKVPLIARWPGRIQPGSRNDNFVYNFLDLAPTILEAAELDIPEFFQGRSLMPILQGNVPEDWRDSIVATYNGQQFGLYTQRMIRTRHWKYIWNTTDVDELYHLQEDPNELTNLIHEPQYAETLAMLRRQLYEQLNRDGDGLVRTHWMKNQLLKGKKL
jgi:arylsulfatase A-like enzyme